MLGMNSDVPTMFIENAGGYSGGIGRVGIGTTDPDGILHLLDEANSNTDLIIEKADGYNGRLVFQNAGTELANIRLKNDEDMVIECDQSNGDIIFKVNDGGVDTEVMRINGFSSNVGIGTASPAQKLHVQATGGASTGAERMAQFSVSDADTDEYVRIGNTNATQGEFAGAIWGRNDNANSAAFSFVATADLDPTSNTVPVMLFNSQFGTDPVTNRPLFSWTNDGSAQMLMDANGNLGIGTTAPQGRLDVNGTVFANLATGAGGNTVQLVAGQLVEFTSTINHKRNVEDLQFDKEAFLGLRPVSYTWKDAHGGLEDVGLIAEEVEQQMPSMVNYGYKRTYVNQTTGELLRDSIGNPVVDTTQLQPWGVDYRKISVYLLALAKEQDDRLNALEAALAECCHVESPQYRMDSSNPERQEIKSEIGLKVFPNPNDGNFTLDYSLPDRVVANLYLITTSGQKMMLSQNIRSSGKEVFNINGPIGVYHLVLEGADSDLLKSVKIVVSR